MCKSHNPRRIDACMFHLIGCLKLHSRLKVLACCCGHGKYPMTLVYQEPFTKSNFELFSSQLIPRKKKFYKKDKKGFYYIPEVV